MKSHRFSLLCAALVLLASNASAVTLSLGECLSMARESNPALRSSAWDSRIAREGVRQAESALYPRLDAQAGYTIQKDPQAVIISGRIVETQEPDYLSAGLSASYTLYDFGRRSSRTGQATAQAESAEQTFEFKRSSVALQVIDAYFGILEAGRMILASADEVALVEEHRRVAQVLFEEGVVTRNDVLQADVRLASARQKQLSIRSRHDNIWLQLNFLTGSPAGFRAELDGSATMDAGGEQIAGTPASLSGRHDIQALRHGLEAREHEVRESRSNLFPELYTRLGVDYVQNNKVREQTIMSAMVGIRVNLFDGFASTVARETALKNRSKSQDTLRLAEGQARLEADMAANDQAVAGQRITVAESAIRQSEENLRINRERYQERVGTATEVLDAQSLMTQAKTDYYRAVYDHQTATARLRHAQGEL
jgi:outer membrane protein TolC